MRLAKEMMNEKRWADFEEHRDADFSYEIPGVGRFRVNAHYQRNTVALAIRTINDKVRPIEQLFLPEIVHKLTYLPRGLILVTGPTGSGKSHDAGGMVDAINRREQGHIITLEDPIEYAFVSNKCCIEQREVGADVPTFASGLRHVLRQDPDVILVGEMRDLETVSAAITAAETGHLVFSTLHTVNAPQTIERIIDVYPADEQNQIRSMLANTLQAVISQTLFKRGRPAGHDPGRRDHAVHARGAELHPREPHLRNPEHHRDQPGAGHADAGQLDQAVVRERLHQPRGRDRPGGAPGEAGAVAGGVRRTEWCVTDVGRS